MREGKTRRINGRKIWGRIHSVSVLDDFSSRCVLQVWIFIELFSISIKLILLQKGSQNHCNAGDEEGISPMFVCLGERQNTPKNFLLLEISLKRLSGLGTCRKVYTRVWQVHQSLFAASAFPAWNAARLQQSPATISSAGAHAMEPTCSFLGSPFVQPLLETHGQGLSLCSISCSKPRDLRLAADNWNFHSR